jgi:hypothetical protein
MKVRDLLSKLTARRWRLSRDLSGRPLSGTAAGDVDFAETSGETRFLFTERAVLTTPFAPQGLEVEQRYIFTVGHPTTPSSLGCAMPSVPPSLERPDDVSSSSKKFSDEVLIVLFSDGRPFVNLSFREPSVEVEQLLGLTGGGRLSGGVPLTWLAARDVHLCGNDTYDATYAIGFCSTTSDVLSWMTHFMVRGPAKDYVATTWFSPR